MKTKLNFAEREDVAWIQAVVVGRNVWYNCNEEQPKISEQRQDLGGPVS